MKKACLGLSVAILLLYCSTGAFGRGTVAAARDGNSQSVRAQQNAEPMGNRATAGAAKQFEDASFAKTSVGRSSASGPKDLKTYPEQNQRSNRNWSPALTDIARHLPAGAEYDGVYRRFTEDYDLVTAGHEWTHYLNACLCEYETTAYYVMGNKYITLPVPKKLRGCLPDIPTCLQGKLYELYFVKARESARFDPLYLLNEWTAYTNDVTVAVDQLAEGKPLNPFVPGETQPDTAGNVLEFTFYGCAVGMAVKKHDPEYYASEAGQKLREFITFNALRSLDVYGKALRREALNQGDSRNPKLLSNFRRSADTAEMREWVKADLDKDLANALLGVEGSGAARPLLN
jgi:hypothetical protein